MSTISTKLTKLLSIRTPVVCGAMAAAGGGSLAAHTSLGGGFGFIGAGYGGVESFKGEVDIARKVLNVGPHAPLPIGIGYLGWQLEQTGAPALQLLNVALESKVKAVWLSAGERLPEWIAHIRNNEPTPGAVKIFIQVGTAEQALVATNEWKADVVVVQGAESGGHGYGAAPSTMTLLSETLAIIPKDGPPILAAGGLTHGGHLAAVLALGASGAVFGTRFLVSPESLYTDVQRKALLAATTNDSVRSMAFDHARNTLDWPRGIDGRGLRNSLVDDFETGVDPSVLQSNLTDGIKKGDPNRMVIWGGAGIGLINSSKSAKDVVEEIHQDCVTQLQEAASLIQPLGQGSRL